MSRLLFFDVGRISIRPKLYLSLGYGSSCLFFLLPLCLGLCESLPLLLKLQLLPLGKVFTGLWGSHSRSRCGSGSWLLNFSTSTERGSVATPLPFKFNLAVEEKNTETKRELVASLQQQSFLLLCSWWDQGCVDQKYVTQHLGVNSVTVTIHRVPSISSNC